MKFQNPSFKFFLNGRTHGHKSRKQYAPHFFKVGGIIKLQLCNTMMLTPLRFLDTT